MQPRRSNNGYSSIASGKTALLAQGKKTTPPKKTSSPRSTQILRFPFALSNGNRDLGADNTLILLENIGGKILQESGIDHSTTTGTCVGPAGSRLCYPPPQPPIRHLSLPTASLPRQRRPNATAGWSINSQTKTPFSASETRTRSSSLDRLAVKATASDHVDAPARCPRRADATAPGVAVGG